MPLGARPRPPEPKTMLLKCQAKFMKRKSSRCALSAGEGARAPSKAEPSFSKLNHYFLLDLLRDSTGGKEVYRAGCFKISANACRRFASAALFALVASFSNAGAIFFKFPVSPFWIAVRSDEIRSADKACDRSS